MSDVDESYPPVLRELSFNQTENKVYPDDDPLTRTIQDKDIPVPVIDLQSLDMSKLEEACRDWGIFRLVNHGISLSLRNQLLETSKQLFSLPFESKQSLFTSPLSYFWGTPALTPSGTALQRDGTQSINLVDGFNVPLSQLSHLQVDEDQKLESFRVLMQEYGKNMYRVAATIFEAMAKTLKLEPEKSRSEYLSESTGSIRVYRYPGCSVDEVWGMDIHTDSSVVSILNEDQVEGLEFMKDGEWLRVKPVPDTLLVNLGDMMQAISNDEYKSVKHRVRVKKRKERYSICYFVFPGKSCVIQSSNYTPFTYSDFQAQVQLDIISFGSKVVGLDSFKIHPN